MCHFKRPCVPGIVFEILSPKFIIAVRKGFVNDHFILRRSIGHLPIDHHYWSSSESVVVSHSFLALLLCFNDVSLSLTQLISIISKERFETFEEQKHSRNQTKLPFIQFLSHTSKTYWSIRFLIPFKSNGNEFVLHPGGRSFETYQWEGKEVLHSACGQSVDCE